MLFWPKWHAWFFIFLGTSYPETHDSPLPFVAAVDLVASLEVPPSFSAVELLSFLLALLSSPWESTMRPSRYPVSLSV